MNAIQIFDQATANYVLRITNRIGTYGDSTMSLKQSFIDDGDNEVTAKQKVTDLDNEISAISGKNPVTSYWVGNKQPLIDAVNASVLAHMTTAKKTIVTDILNQV